VTVIEHSIELTPYRQGMAWLGERFKAWLVWESEDPLAVAFVREIGGRSEVFAVVDRDTLATGLWRESGSAGGLVWIWPGSGMREVFMHLLPEVGAHCNEGRCQTYSMPADALQAFLVETDAHMRIGGGREQRAVTAAIEDWLPRLLEPERG